MSARSCLHARRPHEVFEFEHLGQVYTAGLGFYGHGRLGEVFLNASKAGSTVETHARDSAVVLSLLLQYGCPIETIRHAVTRLSDGSPAGPVGTLLDLIAKRDQEGSHE